MSLIYIDVFYRQMDGSIYKMSMLAVEIIRPDVCIFEYIIYSPSLQFIDIEIALHS